MWGIFLQHGEAEEKHRAGIQECNPDSKTLGLYGAVRVPAGVGNLHLNEGIMNHVMYIYVLKQN